MSGCNVRCVRSQTNITLSFSLSPAPLSPTNCLRQCGPVCMLYDTVVFGYRLQITGLLQFTFFLYCECQRLVCVVIALIRNKIININSVVNLIDKPFSHCSLEEKLEIKRLGHSLPDLTVKQNIKSGTRLSLIHI